jgi:hypothetical protein
MVHCSKNGLLYYMYTIFDKQKYYLLRVVKQLHKVLLVCRSSENTNNVRESNTYNFNED